ncbi:hypothetical protein DFS33DRAFT_1339065 [Desarmillaria ectypa]|nr:hypothetical protein DFS33DRAFT_1339065 [Desarmillaria ectypa]
MPMHRHHYRGYYTYNTRQTAKSRNAALGASFALDAVIDLFVESLSNPTHPFHFALFDASSLLHFWNLHALAELSPDGIRALRPSFLLFSSVIVMAGTTLNDMIFIMPSFAPQLIEIMNKDVDSLEEITSLANRDFTILQQAETTALITTMEMIAQDEGEMGQDLLEEPRRWGS